MPPRPQSPSRRRSVSSDCGYIQSRNVLKGRSRCADCFLLCSRPCSRIRSNRSWHRKRAAPFRAACPMPAAGVPGATVEVTNRATGVVTTATSNEEGNYRVPFLNPGTYRVTVDARRLQQVRQPEHPAARRRSADGGRHAAGRAGSPTRSRSRASRGRRRLVGVRARPGRRRAADLRAADPRRHARSSS